MATETTSNRTEICPTLDPHLFTFKPKLNDKSNEIAQNLLSDFYERQLKHVKRLQEFVSQLHSTLIDFDACDSSQKEIAASNYRNWYCQEKRPKNLVDKSMLENKPDEPAPITDNDSSTTTVKGKLKTDFPHDKMFNSLFQKLHRITNVQHD